MGGGVEGVREEGREGSDLDTLHEVELCANHTAVLAEEEGLWNGKVNLMESRENTVFPVHLQVQRDGGRRNQTSAETA